MMLGLCRGIWYLWAILGTFAKYGEFLPILGHPQQQIRHGLALGKHKRINAYVAYVTDISDVSVTPSSTRWGKRVSFHVRGP